MTSITMPLSEITDDLMNEIKEKVAMFSVGIWGCRDKDYKLIGSGTLVEIGGICGVLTARHVVTCFPEKDEIGLVIQNKKHRLSMKYEALGTPIMSEEGETEYSGPDIAFFRLPETLLGIIKANKVFLNLEVGETKADNHSVETGIWCLFGFAEIFVSKDEEGNLGFFGQAGIGTVPEDYESEAPFDYCWKNVEYSGSDELPSDYSGVSGGGLWQLIVERRAGQFKTKIVILRGVAFYQSETINNERRIRCHGHRSIYSFIADKIKEHYC